MKKSILFFSALLFGLNVSVFSQEPAKKDAPQSSAQTGQEVKKNGPLAKFDKLVYDFPDLTQGNPGTASFTLTNAGNEPLLITSASPSCGCTNLQYSKDPILPGKSVTISATYNASAIGPFMKTITVQTNAQQEAVILKLQGKVVAKQQ
jgi:hypothetical protein